MADLIKSLVDFREARNLTQEQVAEKLGISVRTYQSIEQSGVVKKVPIMDSIKKLLNMQIITHEPVAVKTNGPDLKDELIKLLKEKIQDREKIQALEKKIAELEKEPYVSSTHIPKKLGNGTKK